MALVDGFASLFLKGQSSVGWLSGSKPFSVGKRAGCLLPIAVFLALFLYRSDVEAELSVEDYEIIGEALHATQTDEWPRALRLMGMIDDPLASKLFHWVALIEGQAGSEGVGGFDALSTFILDNPDWPGIDDLQERAEARLTDSADKELTSALFSQHLPLSTRGRIRFAEALFARGETSDAVWQIRQAWTRGDFSAKEEKAFLQRHERHLRAGDHGARLEQLLWDREWQDARRMLPRVSNDYARLGKARIALQTQAPGVDQAIEAVPAELADDPGLQFDRARWRRLKGKYTAAKELLLDPPDRLVRPERWWFERAYHVRRSIEARQFDEAYRLASQHGQFKGGDYAEAEWLSGWLALRFVKRPKSAFRHFVRLYDRVEAPVRQARAAYWAGRAAAALQDEAGAVAWYRRAAGHAASYYGQLAAAELGGDAVTGLSPLPTESERAAFEAKEIAAVARMLIAAGSQPYLDDFLGALAESAETAAEIGMVAEYANAAGRPTLVARLGRSAAFDGKVHEKTSFPIPRIEGLLRPAATVEPSLLLSLARQESMFRSDAASPAGAQGLMQLIPSTARNVAKQTSVPYDRDRLTADPDYNAFLGGHYIDALIERFEGAVPLALAGYNAGPVRVKRWLERHGDPRTGDRYAMIDWIELIPYDETRNYVQRVLEGYGVYKRRLAEAEVELIDYPGVNLLHPPPTPVVRPADVARNVAVTQAEDAELAEVHRPRLKPLGTGSATTSVAEDERLLVPTVEGSFDDGSSRDVAIEEGDAEPSEPAPKL
ncbi:MAG: lytic transglycosylase domain-containing protein [Geminicoccaceae bacterium]